MTCTRRQPAISAIGMLACLLLLARSAFAAGDLVWTPSENGAIGAWLASGPLGSTWKKGATRAIDAEIADLADSKIAPSNGLQIAPGKALGLLMSGASHIDLREKLGAPETECFALLTGVLRVARRSSLQFVVGADDGVRVTVDGNVVFERDFDRMLRDDDDSAAFDLGPGDHPVVVRLHQHSGGWMFRGRLLSKDDQRPARDVAWVLPGVDPSLGALAVGDLATVSLLLSPEPDGYVPVTTVDFAGGIPSDLTLGLRVSASAQKGNARTALFDVSAGQFAPGMRAAYRASIQLPAITAAQLSALEDKGKIGFTVAVGGKAFEFTRFVRRNVRETIAAARNALATTDWARNVSDPEVVTATVQHGIDRLADLIASGDSDIDATEREAGELRKFVQQLADGADPVISHRGAIRLAYRSSLDGHTHPFGLYVPNGFNPKSARRWPLVVVLHGLNGKPMQMIRWFFGGDDVGQTGNWEDRHVGNLKALDAFVVAPSGFGNTGYRETGEADVMSVLDWVERVFPIDRRRVSITGPSMGGIGTAAIALRYADRFSAAAPLCGYHSYFLRGDMAGKSLRPLETLLAQRLSNVFWAENGLHLPMYIVHGTLDLPVENSGVLIDRYEKLGYEVDHEHPVHGHDVWKKAYEDFNTYKWLSKYSHDRAPRDVLLKTASARVADADWLHIDQLESSVNWATARATIVSSRRIELNASGVTALRFDKVPRKIDRRAKVSVHVAGQTISFERDEAIVLHKTDDKWEAGPAPVQPGISKHKGLSGPLNDIYMEPLVFVYGTARPELTRLNYEIAQTLANPPGGTDARWPVIADADLDDETARSHAVFLVGSAQSNLYLKRIDEQLPIHIDGADIVAGQQRFTGNELGALFVYPNPLAGQRYVIVLESSSAEGLRRGLSLPRLIGDFAIFDDGVTAARGQVVLGSASLLAGGMFTERWQLPNQLSDSNPPR